MTETVKDTFKTLFSKLTLTIWCIATAGSTLAGPFGTFATMSLAERFFYWTTITTTSIILGYVAQALCRIVIGDRHDLQGKFIFGIVGTVLIATDVYLLARLFHPERPEAVTFANLLVWVGFVFFAVIAARAMLSEAISSSVQSEIEEQAPQVPSPAEQPMVPRLISRLPDGHHHEVLRLSANDHFVHVMADTGEHVLRMRMRDAVAEMDDVAGAMVHRSHWVACAAMQGLRTEGSKAFVVLKNGDHVPVSRNYRSTLEDMNLSPVSDAEAQPCAVSGR
ncbi:LytTR family DNA-binding domain-containing protein [Cognatishimia maritima]|nr:LytTR family DNA-binding domain-containing protein [Cognatishimia maritima]